MSTEILWHSDALPRPVHCFNLENKNGLKAQVMEYGATLTRLTFALSGEIRDLILRCETLDDYLNQNVYLGAVVGRYANRIENAQLDSDSAQWTLSVNQPPHCLHGGKVGFSHRLWEGERLDANAARFSLTSTDGDQGFPGELNVTVVYRLQDDNRLCIDYEATTSRRTPVNLTQHAYFNLDPVDGDCRNHRIQLNADRYLPINGMGIPLGDISPVEGPMDLRTMREIACDWLSHPQQQVAKGYDHCYFLDDQCHRMQQPAATVHSSDRQLILRFYTDQPTVQLYTGNYLADTPAPAGQVYLDHQGFCLEAQRPPNGPSHPEYCGDVWLNPKEVYRQHTAYQFSAVNSQTT